LDGDKTTGVITLSTGERGEFDDNDNDDKDEPSENSRARFSKKFLVATEVSMVVG
jgi:hypothetical protein